MKDDWTKWLQERAYGLWEDDGRPDGRSEQYWLAAENERSRGQTLTSTNAAPGRGDHNPDEHPGVASYVHTYSYKPVP